MAIPVNGIIEVSLRGRMFGQTLLNLFHYRVSIASGTGVVITELQDFLAQFSVAGAGTFRNNWLGVVPENYFLQEMRVQAVAFTRSRSVSLLFAAPGLQGIRGPALQASTSASLTLQTDKSGRDQIGGKRIPTGDLNDVVDGLLTPGYKVALNAFAVNVLAPVNIVVGGGQYVPCIWHRGGGATVSDDVTACFPQDTARVMRRRTVGLGI